MPHDSLDEIKQALNMWGQWLRDGAGFRLGYPTSVGFAVKQGAATPLYSEDVAEGIEVCMCVLKDRHPDYYWALYYFYYWDLSILESAKKIKVCDRTLKNRKVAGETWVDAFYFSTIFKKTA